MPFSNSSLASPGAVDELVARGLEVLPNVPQVRRYLDVLVRLKDQRAFFASCVLTLELAIRQESRAVEQLPKYVKVLLRAYRNPQLAQTLVGESPHLAACWKRIWPVVEEFVNAPAERRAALTQQDSAATSPTIVVSSASPVEIAPVLAPSQVPAAGFAAVAAVSESESKDAPLPVAKPVPVSRQPSILIEIAENEFEEVVEASNGDASTLGDISANAALPAKPPPWSMVPEEEARAFWAFTEQSLGRLPEPGDSMVGAQSFSIGRSVDRSRLIHFAQDLLARFPKGLHARSLACLTLLYVGGQQKERGLLGKINRERASLLRTGLSFLGDSAEVAGQVAVLFENDGPQTRQSFAAVVEVVVAFLAFCLQNHLDPRNPQAAAQFLGE